MALYLTEADVRQVLNVPMAIAAVEDAHRALTLGRAQDLPRQRTRTPKLALHLLQASYTNPAGVSVTGFKAYTSSREGNRFLVHLYDGISGALRAMISADLLGMIRTGAASGVASRWLANPNAQTLALFGTGWQAEGHLAAQLAVLPISASPVLETAWVLPGAHINAAGSNALIRRELPEDLLRKACPLVVDTVETALREAGDLLPLLEKGRLLPRQLIELGDIVAGRILVKPDSSGISVFESQGLGVQDMAVALAVLEQAEAQGLGQVLPVSFAADSFASR